ncbi:MAG: hypothetical protein NVS3B20_09640 [Polyangiales bacterium]
MTLRDASTLTSRRRRLRVVAGGCHHLRAAKVVVGNLLEGNTHRPDYRGVPSVAFTMPPMLPWA